MKETAERRKAGGKKGRSRPEAQASFYYPQGLSEARRGVRAFSGVIVRETPQPGVLESQLQTSVIRVKHPAQCALRYKSQAVKAPQPRRSPPVAHAPKLCLSADGTPLSPPQAPCCWANAPTESWRAELGWALSDLTLEQPGSAEEEEREEEREREREEEEREREEEEEKEGETAAGLSKCTQEPR
ncbi:hypothetical protein SRHO_G00207930 [Serrasalmus rhombeus]